jgi:hypothetical protein
MSSTSQTTQASTTETQTTAAEPQPVETYTCYVCHILKINGYTELCDEPHDGLTEEDCICEALPDLSYNFLCAACLNQ